MVDRNTQALFYSLDRRLVAMEQQLFVLSATIINDFKDTYFDQNGFLRKDKELPVEQLPAPTPGPEDTPSA